MQTIWNHLKESLINTFHNLGLAWWVEIVTQNPRCTYYFGPFLSSADAKVALKGYVEDLEVEGAQGILVNVKRCKPGTLTIAEDLGERIDRKVKPAFSGQI
ncbi:DUF1816 domain-containing protein [Nodularia spumigena CS-584]|jgi:hypothetical protein|uniref:DUF1816 domain-containing protein n=1 Tax=Nodularia spumigena UHCC 0060 TaxID=3110300 RepID=A0ABU5UWR2_NODSP|nr:DUF1816 domain-containing protein [Nodularia spumigena]EAW44944.1 hypothetical protein N9414_03181 [Nodularia spumigena CCY9414]MDB9383802.1 DUF1816 domain-containing protein [Nodularia spumigena CS-584]MEA5524449.1 DUF1816 domain-containing protein [Nodularia spumigena UHCC 0143]MEA5555891.1 DUF1816 domain-containing protein [Nodularia spumigena CH309]MEA5610741.1 DUF1816 domain-containing protein [Nodularia spumigena UHCC 0060]